MSSCTEKLRAHLALPMFELDLGVENVPIFKRENVCTYRSKKLSRNNKVRMGKSLNMCENGLSYKVDPQCYRKSTFLKSFASCSASESDSLDVTS